MPKNHNKDRENVMRVWRKNRKILLKDLCKLEEVDFSPLCPRTSPRSFVKGFHFFDITHFQKAKY